MISSRRGSIRLKNNIKTFLVLLIIVALAGTAGYFWNESRQAKKQVAESTNKEKAQETKQVLTKLKQILLIEEKEQPTIARIDNPEKLKKDNPEFYKNAQKGDYIIVYKERAIIFRTKDKGKIINLAPIVDTSKKSTKK